MQFPLVLESCLTGVKRAKHKRILINAVQYSDRASEVRPGWA